MVGKELEKASKSSTKKQTKSADTIDKIVDNVCKKCGEKSMISSSNYMRRARWFSEKGDFICRVVEEKAFYYGMRNKRSFRLIAIAVIEEEQGNGLGSLLVAEMIEKCSEWGLEKITFRTHKNGNAVYFWKKIGAIITGEIGEDYEMRIDI